jgi:hypothetical protein
MCANGHILKIGESLDPQLDFWVPYFETKPSTANLQTHLNPLPTCTGILARVLPLKFWCYEPPCIWTPGSAKFTSLRTRSKTSTIWLWLT